MDVGEFDPLLGSSYSEIAAISRSMHKSQGFGAAGRRGTRFEYFKLVEGSLVGKRTPVGNRHHLVARAGWTEPGSEAG